MEKADEQEQIKAKELGFREAYIDEKGVICYRKPSSRVNEKEYKKEPKTHEVLLTLAVTGDIMALNRNRYKNVYL